VTILERIEAAVAGAGRAVGDAIERLGTPLSGRAGATASAFLFLLSMILRAAAGLFAGTPVGLLRLLAAIPRRDRRLALRGVGDIAASWAGGAAAFAGSLVGLLQTALFLQPVDRPLDERERDVLRRVYGPSVALDNVRIVAGRAGLFSTTPRPFTLGNRLYMQAVDTVREVDVLVHECGHIWQHQHLGPRYIADSLWAQWSYKLKGKNAYDWREETRSKARWQDFNFEAQAEFLSAVFRGGRSRGRHGEGAFFEDPAAADASFRLRGPDEDLTDLAREAIEHVRGAGYRRPSEGWDPSG
jgi:hypothetical protein